MTTMTTGEFRSRIRARMPGPDGEAFVQAFDALTSIDTAAIAALEARLEALIVDYNTMIAKLNADTGVADTNYATTDA